MAIVIRGVPISHNTDLQVENTIGKLTLLCPLNIKNTQLIKSRDNTNIFIDETFATEP